MKDWDLAKLIAESGTDQDKLGDVILSNDFSTAIQAQDIALNQFHLTKENVNQNLDAAKKLASFDEHDNWTFRASLRQAKLQELIESIKPEKKGLDNQVSGSILIMWFPMSLFCLAVIRGQEPYNILVIVSWLILSLMPSLGS